MGTLFCEGAQFCYTLEPPARYRIAAGIYKISIYDSPHFGRPMPLLRNTPNCPYCEIHPGNNPGCSHCCILVGERQGQDSLSFTKQAFDKLFPLIQNAAEQTLEGCSITVFDPPADSHDDVQSAVTAT